MDYSQQYPQRQPPNGSYPFPASPVYSQPGYASQYAYSPVSSSAPMPISPSQNHPMVVIPQRVPQHGPLYPQQAYQQHYQVQQQHFHPPPPPPPPPLQPPRPQAPSTQSHPRVVIPQAPHASHAPHAHQVHQTPRASQDSPMPSPPVSTTPQPSTLSNAPVDYQLLLLSLAEEYIVAAHQMGSVAALAQREADLAKYYKLMATGLGCIESVLQNFRLHPRVEANLRLRYATLLYEETENSMQAETVLSKGIALCQRSRLLDLKYSMQHLLARVLFKSSPKAAFKSLDHAIPEAEGYQHFVWVYALRFLRVSLSLQSRSHPEVTAALQNLHSISALSERLGDRAIFVTSSTLEAMVHLRSANPDSVEQAQRAIASARSYQLQIPVIELKQVVALLDFLDLACSLRNYTLDQAQAKLHALQAVMDDEILAKEDEGVTFTVPIERSTGGALTVLTGGIFNKDVNGRDLLTFSWLSGRALYALSYYLSSVTHFNRVDDKASKYLKEGIKLIEEHITHENSIGESAPGAGRRISELFQMEWYMKLQLAFIACGRSDWASARTILSSLHKMAESCSLQVRTSLNRLLTYLAGVIDQGSGDLEAALSNYQSPTLALPNNPRTSDAQTDLCILAAINTLLIIRQKTHSQHALSSDILTRIEPLCSSHPNKHMASAFYLVKAAHQESIITTKQCIQLALSAAKSVSNQQLLSLSMNLMTSMFFKNIIGDQALNCARTGKVLAQRSKDSLWICVADGMYAEALEKHGRVDEAKEHREEAARLMQKLPSPLRAKGPGG